jgi:hypothetical protein
VTPLQREARKHDVISTPGLLIDIDLAFDID